MSQKIVALDEIDRDAIARARKRAPADKLRDGLELFDMACRLMRDGIRHTHPDASAAEVLRILRARLRLARLLETR